MVAQRAKCIKVLQQKLSVNAEFPVLRYVHMMRSARLRRGTRTMQNTQCGTDLGLIRTRATPRDDGSYSIEGTKIWITGGEHDLADNIIHLVLAKLPGTPDNTT